MAARVFSAAAGPSIGPAITPDTTACVCNSSRDEIMICAAVLTPSRANIIANLAWRSLGGPPTSGSAVRFPSRCAYRSCRVPSEIASSSGLSGGSDVAASFNSRRRWFGGHLEFREHFGFHGQFDDWRGRNWFGERC